jgi:hypothetical protein
MAREPLSLPQTLTEPFCLSLREPQRRSNPEYRPARVSRLVPIPAIPLKQRRRFRFKPATPVEFVDLDGKLVLQKAAQRHQSGIGKFHGVLGLQSVRTDDLLKELRGR